MFFFHVQGLVSIFLFSMAMRWMAHCVCISQYNVLSLIFTWFSLANIWLTFSIIIDLLPDQGIVIFGGNNSLGQEIVSLYRLP